MDLHLPVPTRLDDLRANSALPEIQRLAGIPILSPELHADQLLRRLYHKSGSERRMANLVRP